MDFLAAIAKAEAEIKRLPQGLGWVPSVLAQLSYCAAIERGEQSPDRLEQLTMSRIVCRELDGFDLPELEELVSSIQYGLQQKHLTYSAKVRLGIHRCT